MEQDYQRNYLEKPGKTEGAKIMDQETFIWDSVITKLIGGYSPITREREDISPITGEQIIYGSKFHQEIILSSRVILRED